MRTSQTPWQCIIPAIIILFLMTIILIPACGGDEDLNSPQEPAEIQNTPEIISPTLTYSAKPTIPPETNTPLPTTVIVPTTIVPTTQTPTPSQTSTITTTMAITPSLLLSGQVGISYSQPLTVSDCTSPCTWSISAGALPDGLSLGASTLTTNTISGTPTKAGPFSFTIEISDGTGTTVTHFTSITITNFNMRPQVVALDTRPGVTVNMLLLNPDSPPKGTVVLFPGGPGIGEFLEQSGELSLGINFVVRSSGLFVEKGFSVAIIDVPSDQKNGISLQFRISNEHVQDVNKIIDYLNQRKAGPIFLVGTSASSLSIAYLGASLESDRINGIVLTSSITYTTRQTIFELPLGLNTVTLPVLVVHHQQDSCENTKFSDALLLYDEFTNSTRSKFVEVLGGDPPLSEPCYPLSYHGFLGRELEVVTTITDWLTGKEVADKIGAQ